MSYFRELPNLQYQSFLSDRKTSNDYLLVKNLFRRVKLRDDLQNVFTIFDKVRKYKPRNSIKEGLYYVSSDNYMPLRGNGWYYHNMVCYCLENDIIKLDNIKYVIKSSLSLKKDYYNKFIDHCYTNIKDYSKLAINSMIGNFKPNNKIAIK